MACNVSREVTKPEAAEVVVIGSDPAGCWAARTLATLGVRATIVDGSHPREKPCGGGVTGRALTLVAAAIGHLDLPASLIRRARFVDAATGQSATVPLATAVDALSVALLVVSRSAFDSALLAVACQAGATLVDAR